MCQGHVPVVLLQGRLGPIRGRAFFNYNKLSPSLRWADGLNTAFYGTSFHASHRNRLKHGWIHRLRRRPNFDFSSILAADAGACLSAAAAPRLIYEIVWLQMLQLVIGGNSQALGVLLGTFMGGMCIGSLLLAAADSKPWRIRCGCTPILELGIAVCAHLDSVHDAVDRASIHGLRPAQVSAGGRRGDLPAAADHTDGGDAAGRGPLGGINAAGRILARFLLRRQYCRGRDWLPVGRVLFAASLSTWAFATWCAVAINVAVAGLAFACRRSQNTLPPGDSAKKGSIDWDQGAWPVYVVTCLSGMCSLGAEVVWTRLLSLQFGGTVYTFSIILGVFLTGPGNRQQRGFVGGPDNCLAAAGVGVMPVAADIGHLLDGLDDFALDAVLAGESGYRDQPVVHVSARYGADDLDDLAGGLLMGGELSAGAWRRRQGREESRAGWSVGCMRSTRSARSSGSLAFACG